MKSRRIAVVEGKLFLNNIRSWTVVNSSGDTEVEGDSYCRGQVFFQYHPLLDNCEFVGAL